MASRVHLHDSYPAIIMCSNVQETAAKVCKPSIVIDIHMSVRSTTSSQHEIDLTQHETASDYTLR